MVSYLRDSEEVSPSRYDLVYEREPQRRTLYAIDSTQDQRDLLPFCRWLSLLAEA
jgi:hypothetical protein